MTSHHKIRWPTTATAKSIVHGKISISTAATKSIFTAENTIFMKPIHSLFHGTNSFSWSKTVFHGTNTFSRRKHFFEAKTRSHGTNTFSRRKHFFEAKTLSHGQTLLMAQTLSHGTNTFSWQNLNLGSSSNALILKKCSCIGNGPTRIDVAGQHEIELIRYYFTKGPRR